MKLKTELVIAEIGDGYAAIPIVGSATDFRGVIQLNETAKDICEGLSEGLSREQIADKLLKEYDGVDAEAALAAIDKVVTELGSKGLIEP